MKKIAHLSHNKLESHRKYFFIIDSKLSDDVVDDEARLPRWYQFTPWLTIQQLYLSENTGLGNDFHALWKLKHSASCVHRRSTKRSTKYHDMAFTWLSHCVMVKGGSRNKVMHFIFLCISIHIVYLYRLPNDIRFPNYISHHHYNIWQLENSFEYLYLATLYFNNLTAI